MDDSNNFQHLTQGRIADIKQAAKNSKDVFSGSFDAFFKILKHEGTFF